jgi:glycosyltransferase involved in cell wall biosynthesis
VHYSTDDTVSVIIPAYNAARYVAEAIDAALAQSHPPHQIIVVDDGSKDNTGEVCGRYGDRIVYIRQQNRGECGARNRALEAATGTYISLLDADDLCAPDRLRRQVAALSARPDAIACFSGHWLFGADSPRVEFAGILENATRPAVDFFSELLVHPITMMFRREMSAGLLFPQGVWTGGDMIFGSLLRRRGPFVILPDVLYGYRKHPGQITASGKVLDSLRQRLAWFENNGARDWPDLPFAAAEAAIWRSYAKAMQLSYWSRRRQEFFAYREALRENWPAHMERPPELKLRWYPDWMWLCKSWLDRLRSSLSNGRHRSAATTVTAPRVSNQEVGAL